MKLKWIFGILLLSLVPLVVAINDCTEENGCGDIVQGTNLRITDVDVDVDDKSSNNLEYGEDISKKANPSSMVKFNIRVENNNTDYEMGNVEMIIEIPDLDLEDSTETEISKADDKRLTLEFKIPSDADEDEYDVDIEISGQINNGSVITPQKVRYNLVLSVEELSEELVEGERASILNEIRELQNSVNETKDDIGSYFTPYTECISKLSSWLSLPSA